MAVTIQSMKFWINAFIPRDLPGYTIVVPKGPHAGKTMIPGPQTIGVSTPIRYIGIGKVPVGLSDCYLTDQRSFSSDIHAESRMHSEVRIDFSTPTPGIFPWHDCFPTIECDCEDGEEECREKGKINRMIFHPISIDSKTIIHMDCAANNPCAPTSRLFGDIDYKGLIVFDKEKRSVEIDIFIDQFPAFEGYATINDGAGVPLFRESPPLGNTVMNLPGGANRRVHCRLIDKMDNGILEPASPAL
jgi:hypothetical protein